MSKEVVAVDIDDVLRPTSYFIATSYQETHAVQFEHPAYMLNGVFTGAFQVLKTSTPHLKPDEVIDSVEEIICRQAYRDLEPIEGSVEGIADLAQTRHAVAVSSSPAVIKTDTEEWVEKWFPDMFEEVHIIGDRWGKGAVTEKWPLLRKLGAACVIDDLLRHAVNAGKIGARAVLFGDYPWNQATDLPSHIRRCSDWESVRKYFGL